MKNKNLKKILEKKMGSEKSVDEEAVSDGAPSAIVAEATKGHVLDVAPGCLAVELPAGYIHDGEVKATAIVREMRGHEEDILAGKGSLVTRLNAIIGNCVVSLGNIGEPSTIRRAAQEFTAPDRMAILIAIRRASLGDPYDCTVTCPECKLGQRKALDLKEIEIIPMPDRMVRERTDVLPSGTAVKWHVIRSDDEEWLSLQKNKKSDLVTLGLLARVDSVGDVDIDRVKGYKHAAGVLKDLSSRDRVALRELFDTEEGSVDTSVQFECDGCGHEWEGKMVIQENFFSLSGK